MSEHPNVEKIRQLFAAKDMAALTDLLEDDVVWHHPGNSPLAGDYKGKEGVMDFFAKFAKIAQETGGSLKSDTHDILGNDQHVVAMIHMAADRNGKRLDQNVIIVFHVNGDGKLTERWLFPQDLQSFDDFMS